MNKTLRLNNNNADAGAIPDRVEPLAVKCANVIREMDKEYVRDIADLVSTFPAPIPTILAKKFQHFKAVGRLVGLRKVQCKGFDCDELVDQKYMNPWSQINDCVMVHDKRFHLFSFDIKHTDVKDCRVLVSIWIDPTKDDLGINPNCVANANGDFLDFIDPKEIRYFACGGYGSPKCLHPCITVPKNMKKPWRPVQVVITLHEDGMVNFRIDCEEILSFWCEFTLNVKDLKALVVLSN